MRALTVGARPSLRVMSWVAGSARLGNFEAVVDPGLSNERIWVASWIWVYGAMLSKKGGEDL